MIDGRQSTACIHVFISLCADLQVDVGDITSAKLLSITLNHYRYLSEKMAQPCQILLRCLVAPDAGHYRKHQLKLADLSTLIVVVTVFLLQGCAYSAAGMRARVIDAETKKPVAGVHVVVTWNVTYHQFIHGSGTRTVEIAEGVSDADGWFNLPSWGPAMLPAGVPMGATGKNISSFIEFFKSGYAYKRADNSNGSSYKTSGWNGKTIEIVRFVGTRAQYAEQTESRYFDIRDMKCAFKKMPGMLIALERDAQALDREGLRHGRPRLGDLDELNKNDGCGSVAEFLGPYLRSEPPGFYKQKRR